MVSLPKQLQVERVRPGCYKALIYDNFCYRNIAHGGTLLSLLQIALEQTFRNEYAKVDQPHLFELHASLLRPVFGGSIDITITLTRLGPIISVVKFSISQNSRESLTGFATHTNFIRPSLSLLSIPHKNPSPLIPAPPTIPNFPLLESNSEPDWSCVSYDDDLDHIFPAVIHTKWYWPTPSFSLTSSIPTSNLDPTACEFWICPTDPNLNFHTYHLGYLVDLIPRAFGAIGPGHESNPLTYTAMIDRGIKQRQQRFADINPMANAPQDVAHPTVSCTLEVKKPLPDAGVRWLYCRHAMPWYQGGKFDMQVTVCDADMDVVAVAKLLHLVIDLAQAANMADKMGGGKRNTGQRTPATTPGKL